MNAYVREPLAGAIVGVNAFQIRRDPTQAGFIGYDVAEKLFGNVEAAVGSSIRVRGIQLLVKGVIAKKGTVLGQSWDGFVMLPLSTFESMYGRRQTMVISVKMARADGVAPAMLRAEEAMRIAHRLRPGSDNDFTIDTGEGLARRPRGRRGARGPGAGPVTAAGPRDGVVHRHRAAARHRRGGGVRRVSRAPRVTPRSDRSPPAGVDATPLGPRGLAHRPRSAPRQQAPLGAHGARRRDRHRHGHGDGVHRRRVPRTDRQHARGGRADDVWRARLLS